MISIVSASFLATYASSPAFSRVANISATNLCSTRRHRRASSDDTRRSTARPSPLRYKLSIIPYLTLTSTTQHRQLRRPIPLDLFSSHHRAVRASYPETTPSSARTARIPPRTTARGFPLPFTTSLDPKSHTKQLLPSANSIINALSSSATTRSTFPASSRDDCTRVVPTRSPRTPSASRSVGKASMPFFRLMKCRTSASSRVDAVPRARVARRRCAAARRPRARPRSRAREATRASRRTTSSSSSSSSSSSPSRATTRDAVCRRHRDAVRETKRPTR